MYDESSSKKGRESKRCTGEFPHLSAEGPLFDNSLSLEVIYYPDRGGSEEKSAATLCHG